MYFKQIFATPFMFWRQLVGFDVMGHRVIILKKEKDMDFCINWTILHKSNTNLRKFRNCNVYINEKQVILLAKYSDSSSYLNTRTELISKCHGYKPVNIGKKYSTWFAAKSRQQYTSVLKNWFSDETKNSMWVATFCLCETVNPKRAGGGQNLPPSTFFVISQPVVIFSCWNFMTFFLQALRLIKDHLKKKSDLGLWRGVA